MFSPDSSSIFDLPPHPGKTEAFAATMRLARRLMRQPCLTLEEPEGAQKPTWGYELLQSRELHGRIATLLLAGHWSGNPGYSRRAAEEVLYSATHWKEMRCAVHSHCNYDLMSAEVSIAWGLALRWLPEQELARVRGPLLRRFTADIWPNYLADGRAKIWWWRNRYNWASTCHSGALIGALLSEDRSSPAREVIRQAVRGLKAWWKTQTGDGGFPEGTGYWGTWILFFMAAALATEKGLWPRSFWKREAIERIVDFQVDYTPHGFPATFGDCSIFGMTPGVILLADLCGRPDWIRHYLAHRKLPVNGDRLTTAPLEAFFLAKPRPKGRKVRAVSRVAITESIQWGRICDARYRPDFYIAVRGGRNDLSHGHLDQGSFHWLLEGKPVFHDLGAPRYSKSFFSALKRGEHYEVMTAGHQSLIIGGRGQDRETESRLRKMRDGLELQLKRGYGKNIRWTRRWRVNWSEQTLILEDLVELPQPEEVELRFHSLHPWIRKKGKVTNGVASVISFGNGDLPMELEKAPEPFEDISVLKIRRPSARRHHSILKFSPA